MYVGKLIRWKLLNVYMQVDVGYRDFSVDSFCWMNVTTYVCTYWCTALNWMNTVWIMFHLCELLLGWGGDWKLHLFLSCNLIMCEFFKRLWFLVVSSIETTQAFLFAPATITTTLLNNYIYSCTKSSTCVQWIYL